MPGPVPGSSSGRSGAFGNGDSRAVGGCGTDHRVDDLEVPHPVLERRHGWQALDSGELLEEGAGLVAEEIADAVGAAGEVHRQTALDVRVGGAGEDLVVPVETVAAQPADDAELRGPVHVPLRAAGLGHEVEGHRV